MQCSIGRTTRQPGRRDYRPIPGDRHALPQPQKAKKQNVSIDISLDSETTDPTNHPVTKLILEYELEEFRPGYLASLVHQTVKCWPRIELTAWKLFLLVRKPSTTERNTCGESSHLPHMCFIGISENSDLYA